MKSAWKLGAGLVVVIVLGLAAMGMNQTKANLVAEVGLLDQEVIIEAYAGQELAAFFLEEDRLLAQFDQESVSMNELERRQLFTQYQAELHQLEEELEIAKLFDEINAAVLASAQAHGVTLVLDYHAVVLGGVDLTLDVLQRLGLLDE